MDSFTQVPNVFVFKENEKNILKKPEITKPLTPL